MTAIYRPRRSLQTPADLRVQVELPELTHGRFRVTLAPYGCGWLSSYSVRPHGWGGYSVLEDCRACPLPGVLALDAALAAAAADIRRGLADLPGRGPHDELYAAITASGQAFAGELLALGDALADVRFRCLACGGLNCTFAPCPDCPRRVALTWEKS